MFGGALFIGYTFAQAFFNYRVGGNVVNLGAICLTAACVPESQSTKATIQNLINSEDLSDSGRMRGFLFRALRTLPSLMVQFMLLSPSHSPLIQALQAFTALDGNMPSPRFVATLSRIVDFAGAMSLSDVLADVDALTRHAKHGESSDASLPTRAAARYVEARGDFISRLTHTFAPHYRAKPVRLPKAGEHDTPNETRDAYLRFYSLYQSEMEVSVVRLCNGIRQDLKAYSTTMAGLAMLDQKLQEILASYSRKALAALPKLLVKRFHHHAAHDPQGLDRFLEEMQQLLLAEWEMRLQPALGLIEAFIIEEDTP